MKILVTGSQGMIGSHLVKSLLSAGYEVIGLGRKEEVFFQNSYTYYQINLEEKEKVRNIVKKCRPDRIIHLAALAHSMNGEEYTWKDYYHLNVECSRNILDAAEDIPVLFISSVDVFGFVEGIVNARTSVRPVSNYAKSKMLAERSVQKKKYFDIFRFSPVYTDEIKRDIQKRYYLKYPYLAYQIGNGREYEILNVNLAVRVMVDWCSEAPKNSIQIIKDQKKMWTPDYIKSEKNAGRAKIVIVFHEKIIKIGYMVLKKLTGENKYTYLLNKAVYPLRTE